jgi:predicted GIY-YIG superfamily endonuclease
MATKDYYWQGPLDYDNDTVKAQGLSGQPGVYLICKKNNDGKTPLRYVGETGDLEKRLLNHFSDQENKELEKFIKSGSDMAFYYWRTDSKERAEGRERYFLYEHHVLFADQWFNKEVEPIKTEYPNGGVLSDLDLSEAFGKDIRQRT